MNGRKGSDKQGASTASVEDKSGCFRRLLGLNMSRLGLVRIRVISVVVSVRVRDKKRSSVSIKTCWHAYQGIRQNM